MSQRRTQERGLGGTYLNDGRCHFRVWAPAVKNLEVQLLSPGRERIQLKKDDLGYHDGAIASVGPGSRYFYRLDGEKERPDPASRFQSQGVHGASELVDPTFPWEDDGWRGLALRDFVIYELHVGTYTEEGTFDAIIPHLQRLRDLGITAVEIMPVGQFPGDRNWGYDGVYPFAVQNSYGGPQGLKRLVNACHCEGLAVVLDVVYNHLGPEGNYFADFGPYFTDRYRTPWGPALNFDGPHSDEVRNYFVENACSWLSEYHIDALRLDAVHAILDHSPRPFLEELAVAVAELSAQVNRQLYLMPESAANDVRLIRSRRLGGYGLDAVWSDDFHHSLRVLLNGDRSGYYQDYGHLHQLLKAYREGFVFSGEYSSYRKRRHGSPSRDIPAERFVVFSQNHDQVGNRALGERLTQLASFEDLKLVAGVVLLSPFIPLLFMGEEYGETAPFPYFISHSDADLIEAVRRGRRAEFAAFEWQVEIPDPQDKATFLSAKLNHELCREGHHRVLFDFYRELIRLRKTIPALVQLNKESMGVVGDEQENVLIVHRWTESDAVLMFANLSSTVTPIIAPIPQGKWQKLLDSAEEKWHGGGSNLPHDIADEGKTAVSLAPKAFALFTRRANRSADEIRSAR